jgi:hypothetical protein
MLMLALRLIHIVFGALWVGMMAFTAVFLMPAIREAGPDGAKVMAALQRRGVMTVMPILALATLVSGMWLFARLSGESPLGLLNSGMGLAFALGGVTALVAFVLGVLVMRPAMVRAAALADARGSVETDQERGARAAEIQRLRARSLAVGRVVTLLLIVAAAAMAIARYV